MLISALKIFQNHGFQTIKQLAKTELPKEFRGVPVLRSVGLDKKQLTEAVSMCPTGALNNSPFSLDMGRCLFCGECSRMLPANIEFTNSWRMWAFHREDLIIQADSNRDVKIGLNPEQPMKLFSSSLHLRQVSAGGDGACEMELNACGNVNFDMRRLGIEFVASPRHADGVVVTGAVSKNMAHALQATFDAIPDPKIVVAVGVDAISGGLFTESNALERSFFERHKPVLYIPGHPAHPLSVIGGLLALMGRPLDKK